MKSYEIYEDDLNEVIKKLEAFINYLLITDKQGPARNLMNILQKLEDSCWLIKKEK